MQACSVSARHITSFTWLNSPLAKQKNKNCLPLFATIQVC
jgi:hypothetical protein